MKLLYVDIETTPLVCLTWGMWQVDVAKLLEDFRILSVAYKWEGEPVKFIRTHGNDRGITKKLHKLFSEADIICAQNGDSFDIKKINARLAYWGFPPPPPYKTVDTLKILKRHFGLTRNSLDFVCQYFGIGKKTKHQGIDLWDACMRDPKAKEWKTLERYNKTDVILLWKLYQKLRPWHAQHPHVGNTCPKCGSTQGQWRGTWWGRGVKYKRWGCNNCRKWSHTVIKT